MDNYAYQSDPGGGDRTASGEPFAITQYPSRRGRDDYLVEVNSRRKIFKKTSFYRILSVILLSVAIILLISLIVIIVLYVALQRKPGLCTSDECLRTAANFKYSIDPTVNPCDNFYEYACGNWGEEHPNHGWFSSFSSFNVISERVAIESLNTLTSETQPGEPEALEKSRLLYESCMDQDTMDELGPTTMYPYLQRVKLPLVPSYIALSEDEKESFTFDWIQSEALVKQIFMMDVLIGALVESNIYNGSQNVLYIGTVYQKCPLPSPVRRNRMQRWSKRKHTDEEDDAELLSKTIKSRIIKHILNHVIMNATGEETNDELIQQTADVILNVTDSIAELVSNFTDPNESEGDRYPVTFDELEKLTDSTVTTQLSDFWEKYFTALFTGTNVTIDPGEDLLYVTDFEVQYLKAVLKYISTTSPLYIELYVWWSTVYAMIMNTSSEISDYITKQIDISSGSSGTVARSRSLKCASLANDYMGFALGYALADRTFPNNTKPKVEKMIDELKQAFVDHVNKIEWMDDETKRVTLEKSKEMISLIGYPDWLFKDGELDKYYEDVDIKSDRFLDNLISIIVSHNLKKLNALRKVHERDWETEPTEVNAFNSFSDNAINIPMAILNYPMYNLGLEVLNYGSIGAILGHELTHGFDNIGRKHDKYGNYVQWWSNKTIETFEELTQCFVEQYDNFTIEGIDDHIDGRSTLGENMADNGGINQAYAAYRAHVSKYGEEPTLPGFENFTSNQLFFLAYGSVWCNTISLEDLKDQVQYDVHCPNSIRVLGTLQNSEDFARAWHCPEGSFMNPAKKCKIW